MYEVYKTKAIIFSKENYMERSKKIVIFTDEFGFVHVDAHGISFEKSKNKNLLQSGNYVDIYMIKGKKKWIISGGEVISNVYYDFDCNALKNLYLNLNIVLKNSIFNTPQKNIFMYFKKYFFSNDFKKKYYKKKEKDKKIFFLKITKKILKDFGYWYKESERGKNDAEEINKIKYILKKI